MQRCVCACIWKLGHFTCPTTHTNPALSHLMLCCETSWGWGCSVSCPCTVSKHFKNVYNVKQCFGEILGVTESKLWPCVIYIKRQRQRQHMAAQNLLWHCHCHPCVVEDEGKTSWNTCCQLLKIDLYLMTVNDSQIQIWSGQTCGY